MPSDHNTSHPSTWVPALDAVLDQLHGSVYDVSPDGVVQPPNRNVMQAVQEWDGQGCWVVNMSHQPAGRVVNASGKPVHGIRVEMNY